MSKIGGKVPNLNLSKTDRDKLDSIITAGEVIIAPTGGHYSLISTALAAGVKIMSVMEGTYLEPAEFTLPDDVYISGLNKFSCKIRFPTGKDGMRCYANNTYVKGLTLDTFTLNGECPYIIGDGSTPGTPNYNKGNYNTLDDCYIRGRDSYGKFSLYAAGDSTSAGANTVAAFDANTMAKGNVIKNCIIEGHQTGDVAVFALQKEGQFMNNTVIGGRLAFYMVRNCAAHDIVVKDSEDIGVFFAGPSYNNSIRATVYNSVNSAFKTELQIEHPVTYPTYSSRNNDIQITGYNCGRHGASIKEADNNNIMINIDKANYHGLYVNSSKNNNFSSVQIKDPREVSGNSLGSGIFFTSNALDNNFVDVNIIDTKSSNQMKHAIFTETSDCVGNKIVNLTTRGKSSDRNVLIKANNFKISNGDIQGGATGGLVVSNANNCQIENMQCKNNTESADNTYYDVLFEGTSQNNVIGKLLTDSTNANKAKYGVRMDSGTSNNAIFSHKNTGAYTAESLLGTSNTSGFSSGVTGKTLQSIVQTNLGSNFNAATGTAEQEVTGLRVTLPVIAGVCTIKITFKGYVNTVTGNNNVRTRSGTDLVTITNNTERDNLYVGSGKTLETMLGVCVFTLDLTTQQYAFISMQNSVNATGFSMSASGARTTVVTEVFK